jgi:hypothetical protein
MRRIPRSLAALFVLASFVGGAVSPVGAQELPPGFTDGVPVGAEPEPGAGTAAPATQPSSAETAATTQRYFGDGAYAAVRTAVAATSRPCTISNDGLTALVLAPVFKESSAATTPSSAPSPMTLSRYDEWTGITGTTNNRDANYGLYAFRNPYTPYQRAYWHPGIGIWQYDSAGLGAPLTTIEAMDVGTVAGDVARIMSSRYCAAAGDAQTKRYEAWRDWGFPCTLCQGFFNEMMGTTPHFANLNMVPGISSLGGTVKRTCLLAGVSGTLPCWYVDPRVGVIQGSTAWATLSPDGGNDPTHPPAPLSYAFYVVDRGTTEERHWVRADTGYDIDIRASRVIGRNARPRSNQSGSGLTWSTTSGLCDITVGRGACVPIPPSGVSTKTVSAGPGYRPVALDANGDGKGDVLWYQPGSGPDSLWLGAGSGSFSSRSVGVSTTYDRVLPADVDGDGDDDVVWYATSSGVSYLWRSNGDGTFTATRLTPGAGLNPLIVNLDGGNDDEIVWYGPGSKPDSVWSWSGATFATQPMSVSGAYLPFTGDFDGNGRGDIFWYAPGSGTDSVFLYGTTGGITNVKVSVNGTYRPLVGDFDGDHADDVMWYASGTAADAVWWGRPGGFTAGSANVNGTYSPLVSRLTTADRDQIVWYAPGISSDSLWTFAAGRTPSSTPLYIPSTHVGVPGAFASGGYEGILWYHSGQPPDVVWYR